MADELRSYCRRVSWLALALAIASVGACAREEGVSLTQLRNMTYASSLSQSGSVKLIDGEYRVRAVPNSSVDVSVKLTPQIAFGDLNGDGREDAAVVLESDPGGSGTFYSLAVVVAADGGPRHIASVDLGDRTDVQSIAIARRAIELSLLEHAPEDPLCCPSQRVAAVFYLRGTEVVAGSNRAAAR